MPRLTVRRVEGATTGCQVVLWVHGYTMHSGVWAELWSLLPEWTHVGVDLPGHGDSLPWSGVSTLSDVAAEIAKIVQQHSVHAVVAMSFGSSVALQLAIDRPDLVPRLVLAAPTIAERGEDPVAARLMRDLAVARRRALPSDQLTDLWMSSPPQIFDGLRTYPSRRAEMRKVVIEHSFDELVNGSMAGMFGSTQTDRDLSGIRAATSVICGTEDMPRFIENARRLHKCVADCTVRPMVGAGHLPLLERPRDAVVLLRGEVPSPT